MDRCPDDSLSECSTDTLSALRSNNIVELDDESTMSLPVNFVSQVRFLLAVSVAQISYSTMRELMYS